MRSVDCLVSLEKSHHCWITRKKTIFKHPSFNRADARSKIFYLIKSTKANPIPRTGASTLSTLMVGTTDFSKIYLSKRQETWMILNQTLCKLIFLMKIQSLQLWFSIKDIISQRLESKYQTSSISRSNYIQCKES